MAAARSRWTDDRLDDMHRSVEKIEGRQDAQGNVIAAHDLQLVEITRDRNARSDRHWALWIAAASVVLGNLVQVLLALRGGR